MGDRVFGAAFRNEEKPPWRMKYVGHFREYVAWTPWFSEYGDSSRCRLPPHIDEDEMPAALAWIHYDDTVRVQEYHEHPPYWTRELWLAGYVGEDDRRAQREALGLPAGAPWPDKETMLERWRKCNEDNDGQSVVHWGCQKPEPILVRGVEIWY